MKNYLLIAIAAIALAACDDKKASGKLESFDACSCATVQDMNGDDFKKCKELRADAKFEADYQKCKMAKASGLDTSRVTIQNAATATNLQSANGGTYSVDGGASKITWSGEKATGKKESGILGVKGGSIVMENGNIKSGEIVIDMNTLTVLSQSGESKTKLETHLKSDDFFAVASHGESKYVITSSKQINAIQYEVTGNLTVKGITKEMKCQLVIAPNGQDALNIGGGLVFDRSQYDVRYGSDKFFDNLGDDLIKNEIMLTVDIKAKKMTA